jgi:hypothetical protein
MMALTKAQTHLLWVFGSAAPPDLPTTSHTLGLGEYYQKMKGPKEIFWAATLWAETVLNNELPMDVDNPHTCWEELVEELYLNGR